MNLVETRLARVIRRNDFQDFKKIINHIFSNQSCGCYETAQKQ